MPLYSHIAKGRAMNGAQVEGNKDSLCFHPANTALNNILNMLSVDLSKIKIELLLKADSQSCIASVPK